MNSIKIIEDFSKICFCRIIRQFNSFGMAGMIPVGWLFVFATYIANLRIN